MKKAFLYSFCMLVIVGCGHNTGDSGKVAADTLPQDRPVSDIRDRSRITALAEGSMLELALGRFASGQASDQRLKDYGYRMITDHEYMLQQIKHIAAERNYVLPDTVTPVHQQLLRSLDGRGGNRFDSSYMASVIAHQKELAGLLDEATAHSTDEPLKNYAKNNVRLIMDHLLQLVSIRDSINIRKK